MGDDAKRMEKPGSTVLFIRADTIGRGDEDLGANLMLNFLYHIGKVDPLPDVVVLLNAGVKLVAEGSEVVDELKELEERGVRILACGTCLNFFNLKEKQMVGKASNMPEICETLMTASRVITV